MAPHRRHIRSRFLHSSRRLDVPLRISMVHVCLNTRKYLIAFNLPPATSMAAITRAVSSDLAPSGYGGAPDTGGHSAGVGRASSRIVEAKRLWRIGGIVAWLGRTGIGVHGTSVAAAGYFESMGERGVARR